MKRRPIRLTVYNHKGGVGKTTLTVNIASALADRGKSVLLVDTDPQCNLTSYLVADDVVDDLLDTSDNDDGKTVWSAMRPVFNRTGGIRQIQPISIRPDARLSLLPGDIRLSEYEEFLGEAWTDSFKRRIGGLSATTSLSDLVSGTVAIRNYDYVFYDTGPNIGPLNRALLLDTDYFIVPVACDLFSVRALGTLGQTLKRWIIDWSTICSLAPDNTHLLDGLPRFLGYIPQRFRVYGQEMAKEPAHYLRRIVRRVHDDITDVLQKLNPKLTSHITVDPVLGKVKDFGSLAQTAQREGVSLWDSSYTATYLKDEAKHIFGEIADRLISTATISTGTGKASSPRK